MVYQPVNSSFITQAGHDGVNKGVVTLASGKTYHIADISPEAFQNMLDSPSVGKHFNSQIKPNYTVTPVSE